MVRTTMHTTAISGASLGFMGVTWQGSQGNFYRVGRNVGDRCGETAYLSP